MINLKSGSVEIWLLELIEKNNRNVERVFFFQYKERSVQIEKETLNKVEIMCGKCVE